MPVLVGVDVGEPDPVPVSVGVLVGVSVGVSVGVLVGVSVGSEVDVEVGSEVGPRLDVGLSDADALEGSDVGEEASPAELVADGDAVAVGVSSALAGRPTVADSSIAVAAATAAHRRLFRRTPTVRTASLTRPPVLPVVNLRSGPSGRNANDQIARGCQEEFSFPSSRYLPRVTTSHQGVAEPGPDDAGSDAAGEEGQALPDVLAAADPGEVAADEQALRGGREGPHTHGEQNCGLSGRSAPVVTSNTAYRLGPRWCGWRERPSTGRPLPRVAVRAVVEVAVDLVGALHAAVARGPSTSGRSGSAASCMLTASHW